MRTKITALHAAQIQCLYQVSGVSVKEILKRFTQYSRSLVYKWTKVPINAPSVPDKRKFNKGRPRKLCVRDSREIVRCLKNLRETEGHFTSKRIQVDSGLLHVCNRTVRNRLHDNDYRYLRSRKKGLLYKRDLEARVKYCKSIRKRKLTQEYWNTGISMYLDGKGFQFKTNPRDMARAPKAREWRRPGEGLNYGCTAKGSKEGAVNANFMVGISYKKGVVLCHQYEGPITGQKFADIVTNSFPDALAGSCDPKVILMDGCPRQNSKAGRNAIASIGGLIVSIPARSPDLNPIENFFSMVVKKLEKQAISRGITKESFREFSERVKHTMENFPIEKIDKLIESMSNRVHAVIKRKGQRIDY